MTTAMLAGKSSATAALISAAMFDPRPEMRMATRRFMRSPRQIQLAAVDHAAFPPCQDDLAEPGDALPVRGKYLGYLPNGVSLHDRDHADTAIEGAEHFRAGHTALLRQPLEHRQDCEPWQIDCDTKMPRQDARDVVGKAAARDMRQPLYRARFADRTQTGFHIKPCWRQQRATERHDRRKRRLCVKREGGLFDDPANQRKPV